MSTNDSREVTRERVSRRKPFPENEGRNLKALLEGVRTTDSIKLKSGPAGETLRYDVELITPLFGGGVKAGENDTRLPIRAKSLRGQLRFWWRFLASQGLFDGHQIPQQASTAEIYAAETARWGGSASDGTPRASRIRLRVYRPDEGPPRSAPFEIKARNKDGRETRATNRALVPREIEYALFSAKAETAAEIRHLILSGLAFRLELSVVADPAKRSGVDNSAAPPTEVVLRELTETVKWWATFGGIGARWRRGAGAVRVRADGKTLSLISARDKPVLLKLPKIAGLMIGLRPSHANAQEAWQTAISRLRDFRQMPGLGRKGQVRAEGRSHWPEPDLIRSRVPAPQGIRRKHPVEHPMRDWAPRAAFGMPLGIRFSNKQQRDAGEPAGGEIRPLAPNNTLLNRMASPVILRPVALADDSGFVPCALLLPHAHEVLRLSVGIDLPPLPSGKPPAPVRGIWPGAPSAADVASVKPIGDLKRTDPLHAFMAYFTK